MNESWSLEYLEWKQEFFLWRISCERGLMIVTALIHSLYWH